MEPETIHTIPSMKPQSNIATNELNESLPDGSWQKKVLFRRVIQRMLTISSLYLKAVLKSGPTFELSPQVLTAQRATALNECNNEGSGCRIRRQCVGPQI